MERPSISPVNIKILMENLVKNIRKRCYAPCSVLSLNCSEPTQLALFTALDPVFKLNSIRPVKHMTTSTNVTIYFTMYGILGVDEKAQLLMTYIWLSFWWNNEYVSWDPKECGTSKIPLPRNKFWVPDIVINEFMDENKAPSVPYVYLHSDGRINDGLPVKVVSSCNLDIYTFPFDIQNCTLTFNSYLHRIKDIRVVLGRSVERITNLSKEVMTTMGEWELIDITYSDWSEHSDENEIDELAFHVRVRRRATLYVVNLIIPSCFLITVDLFSFLLPPQSVDRSAFKMTLILGYTVFLLIMNDLLPITGNIIPLINVFFSLCLALMVASLLETILITDLLHSANRLSPMPRWVRVLVLQIFGCLVCLPWKPSENTENTVDVGADEIEMQKESPPNETALVNAADIPEGGGEKKDQLAEDTALQELRSLGEDLKALRFHVDQQLGENPITKEWVQCHQQKIKCSRVLFIFISLFLCVNGLSVTKNCTSPDPVALLEALGPVFELSSIRPVSNLSTPTMVSMEFIMFGILGVDEKAQLLTTFIWHFVVWENEFMRWDPDQCGSAWLTVPREKMWVPDIVINEFMEKNTAPSVPYVYLNHDGTVTDDQPVKVISSCRLDIYLFPFDTQNCTFSFNSYILRTTDMQISVLWDNELRFNISKEVMTTMGEWHLVGLTAEKLEIPSSSGGSYNELRYYVSVRRSPTMYVVNLLLPSCLLVAVDLFSFLLPPQSVDRSQFKMTLILGYTMFLLIMNNLLPVTGNTIPLMNVFLTMCLVLMVGSLLETIIITNLLCGAVKDSEVPWILRLIILQFLGPLVLLPPKPKKKEDTVIENPAVEATDPDKSPKLPAPAPRSKIAEALQDLGRELHQIRQKVEQQRSSSETSEEWFQMGYITDRVVFITYIIFISVSFITIVIMWAKAS
ncbi:uncharacterized protein LOC110160023 isoform X2 [Boleophthalmus pectinirostris]|nr:uncharacterized protein LOC110160023 isoform X2 [Boleophthalmus pectinirostris]